MTARWFSASKRGFIPLHVMPTAQLTNCYKKLLRGEYHGSDGEPLAASEYVELSEAFIMEFGMRGMDPPRPETPHKQSEAL